MAELTSPILPSNEDGFKLPEDSYSQADLNDIELMARLVFAEAQGEPYEGQVAVAAVILNRLASPLYPNTIAAIIYQPQQFEPVANNTINNIPNNSAYEAVLEAMSGEDPSEGALFYWNPYKVGRTSWVWTRSIIKQIGDHVFAE